MRATKFRGFRSDHDMVPLGPLRTAAADASITSHYRTITDKYTGQVWNGLNSARLEGVASYNSYINSVPGVVWVIHPNWYVSAGYRKNKSGNVGALARLHHSSEQRNRQSLRKRGFDLRYSSRRSG